MAMLRPYRFRYTRGSLVVLTYHRVLPRDYRGLEIVEPGMYVHDDTFAMHLRTLRDEVEFVHLAEWLADRDAGRPIPVRACAITFDDGWKDNYDYAYPILAAARVPATVFVVSGMVGTKRQFWPERLAAWLSVGSADPFVRDSEGARWADSLAMRAGFTAGGANAEQISSAIAIAKELGDREIHRLMDNLEEAGFVPPPIERAALNWDELREMQDSGLVAVGSHTVNHVRLQDGVDDAAVEAETTDSARQIASHLGTAPAVFCYPNGDVSGTALKYVRSTYAGACTTRKGWNGPAADAFLLKRMTLHEGNAGSRQALLARISGLV